MDIKSISLVSKQLNVSTRTLRYYEEIGLIKSIRKSDSGYRMYDETTIAQIKQIVLLKNLNLKLKDIKSILSNADAMTAVDIFQREIIAIDSSIDSLTAIKEMLKMLIVKLQENCYTITADMLLSNDKITDIISPIITNTNKKENISMINLKKNISDSKSLDTVRILYIPPSYVASSQYYGIEPETKAYDALTKFAAENNICEIKPDLRVYGFNNPMPVEGKKEYGYEFYITISEDMEVPAPLEKKHFKGGLYAAYGIKMGDFHKWAAFSKWVENSEEYEYERREPLGMSGSLEEHLNAISYIKEENKDISNAYLDLLIPVKPKDNLKES